MKYIDILPINYIDYLTYELPEDFTDKLSPGQEVLIPFGKRKLRGIFIKYADKPRFATRPILKITNNYILTEMQTIILEYLSNYYFSSPIKAYKLMQIFEHNGKKQIVRQKKKNNKYVLLDNNSLESYQDILNKNVNKEGQILFVFPDSKSINDFLNHSKDLLGKYSYAAYTSKLKSKEKNDIAKSVYLGNIRIILGTRASIFLPYKNLRLIIIDKESEDGHKNEETPRYSSLELSEYIYEKSDINLIVNTNIQSQELYIKSTQDYKVINKIKTKKINSVLVNEPYYPIIGNILENKIKKDLDSHKKVAIFINNTGNNEILMCKDCKEIAKCDKCGNKLIIDVKKVYCKKCKTEINKIPVCHNCGGIKLFSPGASVKKAIKELEVLFPENTVSEISKKATGTINADIIVGTSYLKYFDFKKIESLILLYPENSINILGFSSDSKALYLLLSLKDKLSFGKNLYIKTLEEDNIVVKSVVSDKYNKFLSDKAEELKKYGYPPYADIIKIEIKDKNQRKVFKSEEVIKNYFKNYELMSEHEEDSKATTKKILTYKTMKNEILYDTILKSIKNITIERNPFKGI